VRWDLPLRLLAGMHYLALSEVVHPWSDPAGFVEERLPWLARFVSEQEVQTNEVLRSWALLPAFLTVARKARLPLALVELGSSAGLNLVWDRYRYRYEAGGWGPLRADFVLAGEEHRPVPADLLRTEVSVARRVGIDRNPIDVTTEGRALLLQSFVWADQTERLERLRWAIAALRLDPPELVRGDFVDLLPELLAERSADALTVVFQVAATSYLERERYDVLREELERAGHASPLAWISTRRLFERETERECYELELAHWPEEGPRLVALLGFHGQWLEWLG